MQEDKQTGTAPPAAAADLERRRWLQALGLLPAAAAGTSLLLPGSTVQAAEKVRSTAHIVVAGSGLGGIAVANRLRHALEGARITIIDAKEEHNYQPGYTLVGSGIWPEEKVRNRNAEFHAPGIEWVREMVSGFDPLAQVVETAGGQRIRYDFLVVATGLHLDYAQIEGMDVAAIGRNGLASIYASPQAATASWQAMQTLMQGGGEALMTLPNTPLKCAGAPLKMTFMLRDRLHKAGTLEKSRITFHSSPANIFSVKPVNDDVLRRWQALGIGVEIGHTLKAIDIGARRATFLDAKGQRLELPYDFIHVVPPMRAPDAVRNSPLAIQEGALAGWLDVDKNTLQHKRFANVFGIGDINGTPRGKTAATIKKSAPILVNNLLKVISGAGVEERFDGYTSCPLLLREGAALLVEFDYDGNLTPSMPMIQPLTDSYFAWLMKCYLLKPAYVAVLKGRA